MNEYQRIAELEDDGYVESINMCQECGTFLMRKVSYRYRRDVEVVRFTYECPHCGNAFVEEDGD